MENTVKKDSGIRNWLRMLLLTLLLGMFAGLVIWTFLKLVALCTGLIWETAPARTGGKWIIVVLCTAGALAAGILRKKFGDYPESLDTVMGKIKKDHHYSYHPMLVMLLCAFLPLVLGASVGPEAGLTGIIAALCYWVGDNVTFAKQNMDLYSRVGEAVTLGQLFRSPLFGILAVEEGEGQLVPERMPKGMKLVLYALSTASSFAVIWLLNSLFGKAMTGFPSFSEVPVSTADGFLALLYIPVGCLLFLFYEGCETVMGKVAKILPPVLKETLCGLAIGLVALVCPMVLFSGEEQMAQLIGNNGGYGVLFLAGICLLKLVMTSFCLKFGMKGGHFFPIIFACTCMGYALGTLFFAGDPGHAAFAAGIITAAALGAQMKKPLAVTVLLLLCFPPSFLLWGFLSAAAGSGLAGMIEKRKGRLVKEDG
jgi:H+/Cl- antiporter ClcA